jgi:polyhydroxyalkanoate synthesis regulator protein
MHKTILIKRENKSRLYNTESMTYVSLSDLADMLVEGKRIVVQDAGTGEDITSEILDLLH